MAEASSGWDESEHVAAPDQPSRHRKTAVTHLREARARAQAHDRLRYDRLNTKGKMTLRRAGRMHHLHAGTTDVRKRVLALADDHHVLITDLTTGEVLSTHLIEPDKSYWRNQNKQPGRWPSSVYCASWCVPQAGSSLSPSKVTWVRPVLSALAL
jgi:hypothetical protein